MLMIVGGAGGVRQAEEVGAVCEYEGERPPPAHHRGRAGQQAEAADEGVGSLDAHDLGSRGDKRGSK
jgi:hypothetical protein